MQNVLSSTKNLFPAFDVQPSEGQTVFAENLISHTVGPSLPSDTDKSITVVYI